MKYLLWAAMLAFTVNLSAQTPVDGSMSFQTDPDKKYSYYVPSGYDETAGIDMMVGLHPFNTSRWDAKAWRDTLIVFAESNNLLLICPDGGVDGKIDDPIDTSFTSAIIDSMELWFNTNDKYLMGFSWGGKTVYSYGLRRITEFEGFMPIGAAISGGNEIQGLTPFIEDSKWYLVHGGNDSPNTRFHPAVDYLESNIACVSSNLMPGVGHTIDFPNRNDILTEAFEFIKGDPCEISSASELQNLSKVSISPNPNNGIFTLDLKGETLSEIKIVNASGKECDFSKVDSRVIISNIESGLYFLHYNSNNTHHIKKFMIY